MGLLTSNEQNRATALIAEIGVDIKRYDSEITAAGESKKILNEKIEKLIDQRDAADRRIQIASLAKKALESVRDEVTSEKLPEDSEAANQDVEQNDG